MPGHERNYLHYLVRQLRIDFKSVGVAAKERPGSPWRATGSEKTSVVWRRAGRTPVVHVVSSSSSSSPALPVSVVEAVHPRRRLVHVRQRVHSLDGEERPTATAKAAARHVWRKLVLGTLDGRVPRRRRRRRRGCVPAHVSVLARPRERDQVRRVRRRDTTRPAASAASSSSSELEVRVEVEAVASIGAVVGLVSESDHVVPCDVHLVVEQ